MLPPVSNKVCGVHGQVLICFSMSEALNANQKKAEVSLCFGRELEFLEVLFISDERLERQMDTFIEILFTVMSSLSWTVGLKMVLCQTLTLDLLL